MAIEPKTLLPTPVLQPVIDMHYQCPPPHTLAPHQQDCGEHQGPHALNYCPQSSVVASDTVQVTPSSIIGAHTEEQEGVVLRGPDPGPPAGSKPL